MGITIIMCKCMLKDSIIGLQNSVITCGVYTTETDRSPTGLAILPHLKFEHVHLSKTRRCSSKHSACTCMLSNWDLCAFKCRLSVALHRKA